VSAATSVDEVLALYERWGAHHYDEDLSQGDHAAQTAAHAVAAGADDALVAAALLHDVGHLLHLESLGPGPDGEVVVDHAADLHHEDRGAAYLADLFGPGVAEPIALHVAAKRFLVATEPGLLAELSAGSQASLVRQGGPMSGDEVRAFEAGPSWREAVALRRWDDAGKVDGLEVAPVAAYEPLLRRLAH